MSSLLGTITYGDLSVLPGYDIAASGPGNFIVSGTFLAAGASASIQGSLGVVGAASFNNNLTVNGYGLFNSDTTFHGTTTLTGQQIITNTTDAISTSTGALHVEGGASVLASMYIGKSLHVAEDVTFESTFAVNDDFTLAGILRVTNTTQATSSSIGAVIVSGGVTVAGNIRSTNGNLYLADRLTLNSDVATGKTYLNSPAGELYINDGGVHDVIVNGNNSSVNFKVSSSLNVNTDGVQILTNTNSSSSTTGSLIVAGGVGVAMSVNVGGDISAPVSKTITAGYVSATNTAQSTSTTSGAIQTLGGLGVAKNTYIGGFIDVASASGVGSSIGNFRLISSSNGANYLQSSDVDRTVGQWTPLKFSPLGSQASILTVQATQVTIDQTTEAVSATTGALVVSGGVGVSGDIYLDGTAVFNGITQHQNTVFLNSKHLYLTDDEAHGLVYSATQEGPLLFGLNGGALGTTSNSPQTALSWNATRSIHIHGTTETTSSTTGTLTVAGGAGIAKSAWIGADLHVQSTSWTSSGADIVLSADNSVIILRNVSGSNSGAFESSLTDFSFRTVTGTPYKTLNISKETGQVTILNTDDASGVSTGSLQLSGGQSISKSLHVGENVFVHGDLQVAGSISTLGDEGVTFSNANESTSPVTGSVVVSGGMGVAKSLFVGGIGHFVNTEGSTSPITGSLVTSGGLGVAENLNVGGSSVIDGNLTVKGDTISSSTTPATSITTGAVVLAGGIGIAGDLYLGGLGGFTNTTNATSTTSGSVTIAGGLAVNKDTYIGGITTITNTTGSTASNNGALVISGGVGIGKDLNVAGDTRISGNTEILGTLQTTGTVHMLNTTDSTASNNGSLVLDGGLGVAKNLRVGSTVDSTSATTGAVTIVGGLGVSKSLVINGNQTFTGTNPSVTFSTSGNAPPTFATRSTGTRLTLQKELSVTTVDYAIGMDTNATWYSIPVNTSANRFDWYGGQDVLMTLDGEGTLAVNGTTDSSSTASGSVRISGGVGIAKNVYVGGSFDVANTALFHNSVTANANVTAHGALLVTNATDSTGITSGAIVTAGGLGVTLSANIGNNLTVNGDQATQGNTTMIGTLHVDNTTESVSDSTGAVVISGGLGVKKSVNIGGLLTVGGNTTIHGNLYVSGTRTEIESTVLTTRDNVILVNSGPSGSATSGYAMKRFQSANDVNDGDIIQETPELSGTLQTGASSTTAVLGSPASTIDGYYNGAWIQITNGTGSGQIRRINTYDGTTQTATIYSTADQATLNRNPVEGMDWTTVPDATSEYAIFTSQYVVTVYDETVNEYVMATTAINPTSDPSVPIRQKLTVHAGSLRLDNLLQVDTINNYNAGNGTTVEGILHKNHALSGVTSMNGGTVDVTDTVSLIDNNSTISVPLPGTKTNGAYTVLVSDVNDTGCSATFLISGNTTRGGNVMRATSVPGAATEQVTLRWDQGARPALKWLVRPLNGTGASFTYKVKVISVV